MAVARHLAVDRPAQVERLDDRRRPQVEDLTHRVGERVTGAGWKLTATMIADTPPTVITPEMVGQTYGGRKGYRSLRITASGPKKR